MDINSFGVRIANLVNNSRLLQYEVKFMSSYSRGRGWDVKFFINEQIYSDAIFYRENDILRAKVGFVSSNIGNHTGTFLLHLLVLLFIFSKTQIAALDNFANDPARAARGIYSLFDVNTSKKDTGVDSAYFTRESIMSSGVYPDGIISQDDLARERLLLSEGEMRYKLTSDSFSNWATKMNELSAKLKSWPWNIDAENKMKEFIRSLRASFTFGGGKKRSRHFSKKRKRKKKTKTKKKQKQKRKLVNSVAY